MIVRSLLLILKIPTHWLFGPMGPMGPMGPNGANEAKLITTFEVYLMAVANKESLKRVITVSLL
jgi:hypothetical protein